MRRVILESPYAGDVSRNVAYAYRCLRDCISRGEAPIASHLLYRHVLDDNDEFERVLGIRAGLAWLKVANAMVVYTDYGISRGMHDAVQAAKKADITIEQRMIGANGS